MRKFLKKVIKILDGAPRPRGKQESGQSVLEMTLITPLLIILLVGLVEIGWFARNYLTLLEVSRVGARRGAVLGGDNSPLVWNEWASLPPGESYDPHWSTYPVFPDPTRFEGMTQTNIANLRLNVRNCSALGDTSRPDNFTGFYNLVLCQMLASLAPLEMRIGAAIPIEDRTDDIIISVFAVQMINNRPPTVGGDELLLPPGIVDDEFQTGYIPVVVGRYPTKANECNMWRNSQDNTLALRTTERDPFDFYRQGINQNVSPSGGFFPSNSRLLNNELQFDNLFYSSLLGGPSTSISGGVDVVEVLHNVGGTDVPVGTYPLELAVLRNGVWVSPGTLPAFDPYNYAEMVRGFSYTGYHRAAKDEMITIDPGGGAEPEVYNRLCFGSEFSVYDVQNLLLNNRFYLSPAEIDIARASMPNFGRECDEFGNCTDVDVRSYLPNQGIVLVEVFWQHRLLLDIPVFSPVYNILGSDRTTISVWSAFPAPSVTPNLKFNQDVSDFIQLDD